MGLQPGAGCRRLYGIAGESTYVNTVAAADVDSVTIAAAPTRLDAEACVVPNQLHPVQHRRVLQREEAEEVLALSALRVRLTRRRSREGVCS